MSGEYNTGNIFGDSTSPKEAPSYNDEVKLKKLDYHHDENKQKLSNSHEQQLLDRKLGFFGQLFGHEENSSKNITFFILFVLLIIFFTFTLIFYRLEPPSSFVTRIWDDFFPVLTLALGYIFGKK